MTLTVHTARISTRDPDRFDITHKSGGAAGAPFAPSATILRWMLGMREAVKVRRATGLSDAETLDVNTWNRYVGLYTSEMRVSYRDTSPTAWREGEAEAWANGVRPNRAAWQALLARPRVVLVCYCTDPARCHRTLLAGILGTLGAAVLGELRPPAPLQLDLGPVRNGAGR